MIAKIIAYSFFAPKSNAIVKERNIEAIMNPRYSKIPAKIKRAMLKMTSFFQRVKFPQLTFVSSAKKKRAMEHNAIRDKLAIGKGFGPKGS